MTIGIDSLCATLDDSMIVQCYAVEKCPLKSRSRGERQNDEWCVFLSTGFFFFFFFPLNLLSNGGTI